LSASSVIAQSNRYDQLRPLLPIRPTEQSRSSGVSRNLVDKACLMGIPVGTG